jgi:RHS repeat-associated protein
MANHNTTITNNKGKKWTYWFNLFMDTYQVQDPDGKSTYTEYAYYKDIKNYYGDISATIDRNGNRTEYVVDMNTGNTTKVTKPDGGVQSYIYDQWNNVIEEINEAGCRIFNIYDSEGRKLLKKVKPLDGISDYVEGNNTDFAVTTYTYYSKSDAMAQFNCNVSGLLKSETDPEGNTTAYTYNRYGDIASVKDPAGKVTTYTYNTVSQKLSETTAEGNKTQWNYDKNGQVIRQINPDGGIKRYVYDVTGNTLLEVNPNQYIASKDDMSTNKYLGENGTKYEWYENGYQKAVIDAAGNRTEYTWDIYGNIKTETKPNGSIYRYEYDSLNRPTKTYFKKNSTDTEILLSEVSYGILANGNTQITTVLYADDKQKSTTVTVKDYADRDVEVQNADYGRILTKYNLDGTVQQKTAENGAITYYSYNKLGNLTDTWKPVLVENGYSMYSWTGYTYDKAGRVTEEKTGKNLVALNLTSEDTYNKIYTYEKGLLTKEFDSEGRQKVYTYNGEGRVVKLAESISSSEEQVTESKYNYLGKVISVTKKVRAGDLGGYEYSNNDVIDLISTSSYDLNGNLISQMDAAGNEIKYTYDSLDRVLTATRQLKNANGTLISEVKTSQTYTWDGQVASQTDANGNTSKYNYDARGNQTKIIDALDNITLKYYDLLGRITAVVSPMNYKEGTSLKDLDRTVFIYDAMGRVTKQTEIYHQMNLDRNTYEWTKVPVSVTTKTYVYDALGNVTTTTDALGNTTTTVYNLAGMPEYVTDAETAAQGLPFTTRYSYNGLEQKVKEEYQGASYTYTYNGLGNLLKTELNGVLKSSVVYDLIGRAVSTTDGLGNTTRQQWNAFNKPSKTTSPGDSTIMSLQTVNQYDKSGNIVYSKNSIGVITTYTYDSFGRNLSKTVKNESGDQKITTTLTYDLNGNVLSQTDGNGNTSSKTYDSLNREVTSTNALEQKTTFTYDANGNQIGIEDYLGNLTKNVYDGINRLVDTRDAYNNIVQQILYNDANAQVSSFDALHNETKYLYDRNLRQAGTIDAEGNTSTITYDSRGNISKKTDGNGNTTNYQYDGDNHLTKVTDALGISTCYTYDNAGNMIAQTDGNGNTTTYQYNSANLVISKADPLDSNVEQGTDESYTYYANGKMANKNDRNGITTTYTYDIFGRLLTENAGGEIQSYTYDANGNQLTMTDATGTTYRTYDALNRNTKKIVPELGASTYEYDLTVESSGEHAERTTDPKGNINIKTYDKVGRLLKVTVGNEVTKYEYYRNGNQYRVTYPDGTTETYTYDKNNQITTLTNAKVNGTVISSYQYTYDASGNQLTKKEVKGTTTYTYDSLNRLHTVTEPIGKLTAYTYDGAGNRKSEMIEMGQLSMTTLYNYDNRNRLTTTVSSSGLQTTYVYDNNGNLMSKSNFELKNINPEELTKDDLPDFGLYIKRDSNMGTGSKDLTTYVYDNFNRLAQTKSEKNTATYKYNAQGYRVEKKVNNKCTKYLYEKDKVVLETDGSNNQTAFQVYGVSLLYRSISQDNNLGAQSYYYLYNAHGDVTELIDSKGNIAVSYAYDVFGNIVNQIGTANNAIKYAGYQFDEESGLYYLNARHYDSVTARFITEDTYMGQKNDPLSLNLYTYCHNNPILYTDPSGHKVVAEGGAGGTKTEKEKKAEKEAKEKAAKEAKEKAAKEAKEKEAEKIKQGKKDTFDPNKVPNNATMDEVLKLKTINTANCNNYQKYYMAWFYNTHTIKEASNLENASYVLLYLENNKLDASKLTVAQMDKIYNDINSRVFKFESVFMMMTIAGGLISSGKPKSISYSEYDEIYQSSIHNEGKNKIMLGKYDKGGPTSYIAQAGKDYTYFSLGDDWKVIQKQYGFTNDDMFKLFNEPFLDDGINAGKSFTFSHNPIGDTGSLGQEYAYLKQNGYVYNSSTMTMVPKYK